MQIAHHHGRCVGVDGCRAGWLAVAAEPEPEGAEPRDGPLWIAVFPCLKDLLGVWGPLLAPGPSLAVDMVLGLPDSKRLVRPCDQAARQILGRGATSRVFSPPSRAALEVFRRGGTYAEALAVNRAAVGQGFSKQAWFLLPKIDELDALWGMSPVARQHVVEAHPEVAFASLADGFGLHPPKKTRAGRQIRWETLSTHRPRLADLARRAWRQRPLPGTGEDDFLDALALLWRLLDGQLQPVSPPQRDVRGRPMAIWA